MTSATHADTATRRTLVVAIAHAPVASAYGKATEQNYPGAERSLLCFDFETDMTREHAVEQLQAAICRRPEPELLILCDFAGCTSPCAIATQLRDEAQRPTRVLAGLNGPALWTALESAHLDVDAALRASLEAGCGSVFALEATSSADE